MRKLLIFIFSVLAFTGFAQDKVYLAYFEAMNLNKGYQVSTTRIFRAYLAQENRFDIQILPVFQDSVPVPETYQQAWNHAKELQVQYFIKGELDRLGETVLLSVALYKTEDGSKVWSDLLKAKNPDDLDPILQKLAKAIGTPHKASEETDIYTVTDYDSQELKQVNSRNYIGFSIGGAGINYNGNENSIPAGFGISVTHDMRKLIADLSGEAYFGPKALYFVNISTYYPFKSTNNTPYVGGGLGLGGVSVPETRFARTTVNGSQIETENHDNGGLMLFAGGGYLFNRTSSTRIRAGAKAFMPFFKVNNQIPFGAVINLEISFGR